MGAKPCLGILIGFNGILMVQMGPILVITMAISGNIPICKTSSHSIAAAAIGMFHEAAGAALNTASTLHRCCVRWVLIIMSPVRAGGGGRGLRHVSP